MICCDSEECVHNLDVATLAERWLRLMPSLADFALRVSYARNELYELDDTQLADGLNDLFLLIDRTDSKAREALSAFVPVLTDLEHLPRVGAVRAVAHKTHLPAASRLLRCSTPAGHLLGSGPDPEANAEQKVVQRSDGSPLSLGERRSLARRPSRSALAKLMADPHPMVVRVLLANPRLTEDDVIMMAARRPAAPDLIREIARLWSRRARARLALVLNPGSPPAVTVPMLGLLVRPELREASRAADVAPVVRATALELLELRPPMPRIEEPELKH